MIRDEIEKLFLEEIDLESAQKGSLQFCPHTAFSGFHGHFPGHPILPAMLQVLLGVLVAERIMAAGLILKKLDRAKFMSRIKPDETLTVSCTIIPSAAAAPEKAAPDAEIKAQITISVNKRKAASMTLWLLPK